MSSLDGRTALITGASRGIGQAIAGMLIDRGANVCITARNAEPLAEAAVQLAAPGRVLTVPGKARDPQHREDAISRTIERFGSLDLLVNNAAMNPIAAPLVESPLETCLKIFDTNVVAALGWVQLAWQRWMGAHGGAIVNVASVAGLRASPNIGAYGSSKAALVYLTSQLAVELGPGVRVNAVAPAVVRTQFARPLYAGKEEQVASNYPLGRLGEPAEVADAVGFLIGDEARWITGQTLVVDGGLLVTGGVDG